MKKNKKNIQAAKDKSIDEEKRKLVISRLSVLSPTTLISLGSEGSFTRDQLIESIEQGNEVGNKIVEIQIEWLRSFKEKMNV